MNRTSVVSLCPGLVVLTALLGLCGCPLPDPAPDELSDLLTFSFAHYTPEAWGNDISLADAALNAAWRSELRAMARSIHQTAKVPFLECFVDAPLDTCIQRDPKGLYAKAIAGEIANFTGISAPFEAPQTPEVHLETEHTELNELVATALDALDTYTA